MSTETATFGCRRDENVHKDPERLCHDNKTATCSSRQEPQPAHVEARSGWGEFSTEECCLLGCYAVWIL
jgi:hypothetical protein